VIDRVFYAFTRKFFLASLVIFVLGFVAPFLVSVFSKNDSTIAPCLTICSMTMAIVTLLEFMDILKNGRDYFNTLWNYIDLTFVVCWYTYFFIRWGGNFKDFTTHETEYSDYMVKMNVLMVTITLLSFFKIVNFLRVFEGFSSLIMMLTTVMGDL